MNYVTWQKVITYIRMSLGILKGVHYFSVGNYSIFYAVENNVATIIHVSYGRRDLDKVLSDYK